MPLRQKILIGLTIFVGLIILILFQYQLVDNPTLKLLIFLYSFLIPFFLLGFETLIDLNSNRIYFIWLVISVIFFGIYFLAKDDATFLIRQNFSANTNDGVKFYLSNSALSPFKSLFFFLIAFKVANGLMKKITGNYLLNTYRQMSWVHDSKNRKITGLDVLFNILLSIVIIISAMIRLF